MESKLRKTNSNSPDYNAGYDRSYGASDPEQPRKSEVARSIERDMSLEEYELDKEYIIQGIKNALKERNYNEAQELVYKYRAAAKTDENFAVLARLTAQGLETQSKIEKIDTVMDATPDDDYQARIALCNRALKVDPANEKYKQELERCQKALGIRTGQSQNLASTSEAPKQLFSPAALVWAILTGLCTLILAMASFDEGSMFAGILSIGLLLLNTWFYSNHKSSPIAKQSTVVKFFVNLGIWCLGFIMIALAF